MERLVQEQHDFALPDAKRSGDRGNAGNGNRGNGNEQRTLDELDDFTFSGARRNINGTGRNLDRGVHDLPFRETRLVGDLDLE